jgi:predicted NUDIX family NTP pyrophosphohydrolase
MIKQSAGLIVFRHLSDELELLLVHPAGPIYGHKDKWSIPKGELDDGEDHLSAAYREFFEEVGIQPPAGDLIELGRNKQTNGKLNYIWAVESDLDITGFSCNTFTMEWPPRSGQMQEFLENDRAAWFNAATAQLKIFPSQAVFIDRLVKYLDTI